MNTSTPLLTEIDVADLLKIPTRHVRRYVREGTIPHVVLPNGDVRFLISELERWIAQRKHPQAEEPR